MPSTRYRRITLETSSDSLCTHASQDSAYIITKQERYEKEIQSLGIAQEEARKKILRKEISEELRDKLLGLDPIQMLKDIEAQTRLPKIEEEELQEGNVSGYIQPKLKIVPNNDLKLRGPQKSSKRSSSFRAVCSNIESRELLRCSYYSI